jgi:acetolactate synthase I/II/III large subunit
MSYYASTAFLEALVEAGIKYIYGNFGSDHPAILESLAEARATGRKMPEIITCPIEQVGLHIAMGYAHVLPVMDWVELQITGKPQCVIVHVDVLISVVHI